MGMFDNVRCQYPLPVQEAQGFLFQTKDTPAQYLDDYEIREDGTLWHEAYDVRIEDADDAPFGIWMYRDNPRWEKVPYVGELVIYRMEGEPPVYTWYCFRFWFRDDVVQDLISTVTPHGAGPNEEVESDGAGPVVQVPRNND